MHPLIVFASYFPFVLRSSLPVIITEWEDALLSVLGSICHILSDSYAYSIMQMSALVVSNVLYCSENKDKSQLAVKKEI